MLLAEGFLPTLKMERSITLSKQLIGVCISEDDFLLKFKEHALLGGAMVRAVASHQYGQVQIPASTAYVDRVVCQWFSPLPW